VAKRRPNFNLAVRALVRDIAASMEEFAHVRAGRILIVAGEARRASRGTVKPLCFRGGKSIDANGRRKPIVRVKGRRMLYCITLRPLFFRLSTPQARIETLLHELFHVSRRFDGTLHPGRRHAALGKDFARRLRPLVRRYLAQCPPALQAPFAYHGEVRVPPLHRGSALLRRGADGDPEAAKEAQGSRRCRGAALATQDKRATEPSLPAGAHTPRPAVLRGPCRLPVNPLSLWERVGVREAGSSP
jgi:hypothetical protein